MTNEGIYPDKFQAAAKPQIDGIADALGVNDKRFRPILLNYVKGDHPGAMLVAVGVRITTGQELNDGEE